MAVQDNQVQSQAPCPVCGSARRMYNQGDTTLAECTECGLVALAVIPSDAERTAYYAQKYALNHDIFRQETAAEMRRWSRMPEQIKLLRDILALRQPPATILDVGCDRAPFLDEARRFGYTVVGVEPSESARKDAGKIGISVVPHIDNIKQVVDIAVLWHSLEHTGDPLAMLQSLHTLLSSDGIIAIRVPDFGSLWSRLLKHRWIWFQPENHCYHFTVQSLKNVVERAGFDVITIRSQRPSNGLTRKAGAVAMKSFGRYMGEKTSVKRRLAMIYQYLTGIEVYVIAKKGK